MNATLNVNSTGAKSIYYRSTNIPATTIKAKDICQFLYNGTQWELVGYIANVTAGNATTPVYSVNGVPIACTSLSLNTTGSAAKWTTPRTLTIGSTGKSVDGSENISWNHAEIGATVSNAWTAGTTSGPTLTTTVNGVASTAVAIPAASGSASGIVTTGEQLFEGQKIFKSPPIIRHDSSRYGYLYFANNAGTTLGFIRSDCGNATNITANQWRFSLYSPSSAKDTTRTDYYESFYLPTVNVGRTDSASYEIFTSKSYSTLDGRYVNITGDTMTGNLTVGSSTNGVKLETGGSAVLQVQTDGGWARGVYMVQHSTANAARTAGAIGWYGAGTTTNYCYIGTEYNSAWMTVDPSGNVRATKVYGAVWNDYAEFRNQKNEVKPGYCVASANDGRVYKTTEHLQACDGIVSDTYGFAIGETDDCKTPLAVSGRVLAYCEGNAHDYNAGDTVGASANGKVIKMTREEIKEYPDRIVGIVSEIPEYETWGTGNVKVDGRIWIKVK